MALEEEIRDSDGMPGVTVSAIVASAIVAGAIAFLLRRALRSDGEPPKAAEDRFDPEVLRDRAASVTNEFLREHVAPELKPMMLAVLRDVQEYVDRGFQRAEQTVRGF